jgi:N-methylhydantoinase A
VGGTFTDMVMQDADGRHFVFKVPSIPDDPSVGVLQALKQAAGQFDLSLAQLVKDTALFVHGSTVATNTILERKGATVGMLTTEGFRDSVEIRRGIRENQWDHRAPFPAVLVPRYLRLPVRGRIDRDGRERRPIEHADIDAGLATFADHGVESIAICLINSYLNADHEQQVARHVKDRWDGSWISPSSEIAPVMGEYERASTAVINAYLAPKVVRYLHDLNDRLHDLGLARSILLVQSNGGAVSIDQLAMRPVNLVLSGPAAGVGALRLYRDGAESDDLIAMEIGGTSCDVTLMSRGDVAVSDALMIDGYHLATPSVEIHTVGAGGGTIAGVDAAGMLFVGPKGAGAAPGPACYGKGGVEPTVTDAQLLLGRLRPGAYAGGAVSLDREKAAAAIDSRVAGPLGISPEAAAIGIIRLLEQNLLHAVERISIERGHDPRRFTLVAAGGAGPMHGTAVARSLGCQRVYLPRQAGAFCAIGMLHSDIRLDFLRVFLGDLETADDAVVEAIFQSLEESARDQLAAEGFTGGDAEVVREIDLRYLSQQWSIRVPSASVDGRLDRPTIRRHFEAEHDRMFGHIQPDGRIDITCLRVAGKARFHSPPPAPPEPATVAPAPIADRDVHVGDAVGWRAIPVYAGGDLRPGHELTGPLLVEEVTTTVLAGVGDQLRVDRTGNFLITLAQEDGSHV